MGITPALLVFLFFFLGLFTGPEDGGSKSFQNVGKLLPDMASDPAVLATCFFLISCLPYSSALKMETVRPPKRQ
jgi:hypothetical protein